MGRRNTIQFVSYLRTLRDGSLFLVTRRQTGLMKEGQKRWTVGGLSSQGLEDERGQCSFSSPRPNEVVFRLSFTPKMDIYTTHLNLLFPVFPMMFLFDSNLVPCHQGFTTDFSSQTRNSRLYLLSSVPVFSFRNISLTKFTRNTVGLRPLLGWCILRVSSRRQDQE